MHETATKLMRQYSLSLVRLIEPQLSSANKPTPLDLRMMVTYHGLKRLKQFGEGIDSDFHVWHETLVSLAQYAVPAPEESRMERFYWLEDKLGLSLPMMLIMMVLVLASFLIVLMISKLHVTKQVFLRCIFVIFVISIVLTMVEMYQGKVAEQEELFMKSFKEHCPKAEDMTVWERIYSFVTSPVTFEDDKCKKYFKAMLVSPLVSVSPLECNTKVCQCSESSLKTGNRARWVFLDGKVPSSSPGMGPLAWRRPGSLCLRQRLPKPPKTPAKSNAEKCHEYKKHLKEDSERYQQNVLRIGNCAENRLKEEETKKARRPQASSIPASTPARAAPQQVEKQLAEKRENAHLRQAKRRAAIKSNPQKYRRKRKKA
ncbi:chloride channel clic-like 1 [Plakobranchus ocellatus]|uniref:Chloride channel CLIC-like protein 1 n=1 Tax=Plakobranchus ocellatus TaxID=259542 RepID=A0AAV3ZJW8_9GAST|nr:chloride channel clic-like 1 [Plakobranchus ocellatus]